MNGNLRRVIGGERENERENERERINMWVVSSNEDF